MERTCKDCVYRDRTRCCLEPPTIVGFDNGKQHQRDPMVNIDRIACKWHMTPEQREQSDTIRMA